MKKLVITGATIAAALAAASPAMAVVNLTGANVTATLLYSDTSTTYAGPVSAIVGPAVEFPVGSFSPAFGSFDIGATYVTFFTNQSATYGAGSFNGYRLDFTGFSGSLSDLQFSPADSTFTPVSFTVSGNSVFLNVSAQTVQGGDFASLTAVPEASTWAMLVLGLGMAGYGLRSRRKSKVTTRVTFA